MNDILKIIVDAELKKNTSLEESMESLIKGYKKIEIDAVLKDGEIKGLDDKLIQKLEDKIKSLQSKVKSLEGELTKGVSSGFKEGAKEAGKLNNELKDVLKTSEKINKENRKTNKVTTGDRTGFKKTTITTNDDGFVSEEVIKNFDILIKKYEKLRDAKNNYLNDKDMKLIENELFGDGKRKKAIQDLTTEKAQEKRYEKIVSILGEMESKNEKLIQQEKEKAIETKRVAKNQEQLNEKMPFVNKRMGNINSFVSDERSDFIKPEEFARVRSQFENINAEAKDFKVQLKMAEQELKKMEKHAQGLSNLQDAQNDQRKKMNLDIKKSRNVENARYMTSRGVVPTNEIGAFVKASEKLDMSSTKAEIEEVAKMWRKLQNAEREAVKELREYKKKESDIHSLSEKMKELEHATNRALNSKNIDVSDYDKLESKIEEVNREIRKLENSTDSLSDKQKRAVTSNIAEIKREMQLYKDSVQQKRRLESETRIQSRHGDVMNGYGFDFNRLKSGDIEGNQKEIQRQVTLLTGKLLEQQKVYGKIDQKMVKVTRTYDQLGQEIYKVGYTIDRGDREFEDFTMTINATNREVRNLGQNMRKLRPEMTQMQRLGEALGKVPIWATATGVIYGAVSQFSRGFEMILDFDREMTNLKKVANESRKELIAFESDAHDLATKLGKTASEVAGATAEFARLGYSLQEARGLAETALIYANVGDMGFGDASQNLISSLKGFGVAEEEAVEKARKYADIFNEVGNNFAISSEGIGEALKRSSALLHQAGNSIEQSVGLVTAANTTIQNPKMVGTALKTISMRLRGVDEEGKKIVGLVPKLEKYFNRFNSSLMLDENTFKSTFQIMEDLRLHWDELTDIQQAQITELIGGKRQGSIVSSMIENWADATNSYETALNSAGSAQKEFNKYMDSYQYKIGRLKSQTEEFWNTFYDSDSVKNAIDSLTSFVSVMTKLTEVGGMLPMLSAFFLTFSLMAHKGTRDMVLFNRGWTTLGGAIRSATGALKSFGVAMMRFMALNAVMLALTVAVDLLVKKIMKAKRAREEYIRNLRDEVEQNKELISSYQELGSEMERYKTLTESQELGIKDRNELLSIQEKLKDIGLDVVEYYDKEEKAVYRTKEAIDKLVQSKIKQQAIDEKKLAEEEIKDFDFGDGAIFDDGVTESIKKIKRLKELSEFYYSKDTIEGMGMVQSFFDREFKALKDNPEQLREAVLSEIENIKNTLSGDELEKFRTDIEPVFKHLINPNLTPEEGKNMFDSFVSGFHEGKATINNEIESLKVDLNNQTVDLQPYVQSLMESFAYENNISENSNKFKFLSIIAENYRKGLEDVEASEEEITDFLLNFDSNITELLENIDENEIDLGELIKDKPDEDVFRSFEKLSEGYSDNQKMATILEGSIEDLIIKQNELSQSTIDNSDQFEISKQRMAELTSQYDDAISNISFLNQTATELNENHKLGADTIGALLERYPELISVMGDEVALSNAIQEAIIAETEVARQSLVEKLEGSREFFLQSLENNKSFYSTLQKYYSGDLSDFQNIAQAKAEITQSLINSMGKGWAKYFSATKEGLLEINNAALEASLNTDDGAMTGAKLDKYLAMKRKLSRANEELKRVNVGFSNITLGAIGGSADFSNIGISKPKSGGSKGSKGSKSETDNKDAIDAWIRLIELKQTELDIKKEEIDNALKINELENDRQSIIENTNNLLENRKKRLKETEMANDKIVNKMKEVGGKSSWIDANGEVTVDYINEYNKASKKTQESMEKTVGRMSKLRQLYNENKQEITELTVGILEIESSLSRMKIDDIVKKYADSLEDLNYQIDRNHALAHRTKELDEDNIQLRSKIITQYHLVAESILKQREELKKLMRDENLSIEQKEELMKTLDELSLKYQSTLNDIYDAEKSLLSDVASMVGNIGDEYIDGLQDELSRISDRINKSIEETTDYYDKLIKSQENRLDKLDEEIEKEERIKKLRDINEEIEKTKADKRYSYITQDGKVVLSYNKQKVKELEEQRDEMLKQFERDDIRRAIQEEIDRLEQAKDNRVQLLEDELDATQERYEKMIELEQERWDGLIESIEEGTIGVEDILNEFYKNSDNELGEYVTSLTEKVNTIKQTLKELSEAKEKAKYGFGNNGIGQAPDKDRLKNDPDYLASEKRRTVIVIENRQNAGLDITRQLGYQRYLESFHEGGIVGGKPTSRMTEIVNKMFKVKHNERVIKSLKGELQIPPSNFPNLVHNIKAMIGSNEPQTIVNQTDYHLSGVTIKADNPEQLFKDLDMHIRMNRA